MPRTKIVSLLSSATGLLALAISTLLSPANLGAQTDQTSSIVGSWIITVPGIYTDFGKPQRNALTLFPGGGGLFIDKPGHANGVIAWKQTGDRQFTFNIIQIRYDNNNNNSENGTASIKGVVTLNDAGDSLSFIVTGQNLDLDGKVIDSFNATLTAARIQVEPL
jgi:hypothetical protein